MSQLRWLSRCKQTISIFRRRTRHERYVFRGNLRKSYVTTTLNAVYDDAGLAFLQAGQEMGYEVRDVNGEFQTGFALYQFTMRRGTRCSTAKVSLARRLRQPIGARLTSARFLQAFLRPIRLRPNFHLSLWSHATRVLINPDTRRAYGVEFIRDGQRHVIYAKKEVILSAGNTSLSH